MSHLLLPSATLEQKQPIYKVESGCLISKNADVTVAYRLELPEIFTLSPSEYEALHAVFVKAIRLLPLHTVVHKQDWFVEDQYAPGFGEERSLLSRSYERHFFERPFLHHTCFLFLTKTASGRENWNSLSTLLSRSKIVPKEMMEEKRLTTFFNAVSQFVRLLADAGISFTQLTDADLCGTETTTGLLEKYLALDLRDVAPLVDLDFSEGLHVGSKVCQCYSLGNLDDLPQHLETDVRYEKLSTDRTPFAVGFAAPVGLLLGCNHIYNQYLFVDDHHKTLKTFEKKRDNLNALALYSRQNAIHKEFYDLYLNQAVSEQKLSVRAHANVLVWCEQEGDPKQLRDLTSSAIAQMNCKPRENTVDIGALFWAGIPGNAGDFPSEETFYTFAEQACCLWNVETNYRSSPSPFGIKLSDRISGKPVHVDLSDAPMKTGLITNRNKFVLGPSGSGKSFFTNGLVRQYHEQGTHVLLVDTGNSYKGLCELKKGVYFTYEEHNPISFNPFYVVGKPDVEKRESLKTLLVTLWKREDERVSQSEYVSLSTALTHYYLLLSTTPRVRASFNTFYEFLQQEFKAYLATEKVREKDFDLDNFLYVLRPFYRGGEYDYLLNSDKDLNLIQESFIVFELDNIKDHPILFPVVTLIIMDTFLAKMRQLKGVRKMILIEEAWKAIAKAGMAEYIKYLFKTVRKFFGEAIVVTQEVDDIIGNPIVKDTILNNSDCKILLDQRKFLNRFDDIQQLMGLTEKEKAQVLSINLDNRPGAKYKEVFISLGGRVSKVYGVEVSLEEYVTYTTEETEKMRLFQKVDSGLDMPSAIRSTAQELREAG
ncbi:transposase [Hymenobacter qilianensis]|uniref:Transposase n=1 Tax=Hymenobacter qilianensis TaxID=1385715 RepID=A0ACB5PX97_9BACT|nr:TraG family conjugative transposon ATPase [Hymenobacter qilianensis]GGF80574.1 transposase [Hymenobacter qilianensis]